MYLVIRHQLLCLLHRQFALLVCCWILLPFQVSSMLIDMFTGLHMPLVPAGSRDNGSIALLVGVLHLFMSFVETTAE